MLLPLAVAALAAGPTVEIAGERLADPHRWLEDIHAPAVIEWWTARDNEARAWIGGEETQAALARWMADWDPNRSSQLLDESGGVRLVRNLVRRPADPPVDDAVAAASEPAARPIRDKKKLALNQRMAAWEARWRAELVATRAGVAHPLVTPELDESRPVCAWALDRAGRYVAWGRIVGTDERPCRLHLTDLVAGTTQAIFEGRHVQAAFSPDAERLLVSHVAGNQGRVVELTRSGEVVAEHLRSGRQISMNWLPDGNVVAITTQDARQGAGRQFFDNRVAWGPPEELRWLGNALFWPPWGAYSWVGRDGDSLLLRTNVDAPDFRVVRVHPARPWQRFWEEVVPERNDARLAQARLLGDNLLLVHEQDGVFELEARPLASDAPSTPLGIVATAGIHVATRATDALVTTFSVDRRGYALVGMDLAVSPLDVGSPLERRFVTEYATSADGTAIPLSVVSPPDVAPDAPVWLHVYGGFGIALTSWLTPEMDAWLALGGVHAVVHARGGGERGEAWHEAGKLENKHHTIEDVIAAAEWFVAHGTRSERIALSGSSNGGLVVAATVAKRPDLFGAAIAEVGVHDLVRGPAFGRWWPREYGRPTGKPGQQRALRELSPLHATPPGPLPPILLVTGRDDRIVSPAHSFKLAAAWGELPGGPVLLRVHPWTSHARGGDNLDIEEDAMSGAGAANMAFLFRALGMKWPSPGLELPVEAP